VPESSEKPQTLYHHLRLHPYGETEDEKEKMRRKGEIRSWVYEEQIFNEPYENFYDLLTSPMDRSRGGGKGTKVMRGGMVGSVGERTAAIPYNTTEDQPFGQSVAKQEFTKLREASAKLEGVMRELQAEKEAIEAKTAAVRASIA
jgi:YEATS domain-containing protein 4